MKFITFVSILLLASCAQLPQENRYAQQVQIEAKDGNFNQGWKFALSDSDELYKPSILTTTWEDVDLPHDWSIELPFDKALDGATAYLPGGIGWYRKNFKTPNSLNQFNYILNFDGIYNHSVIWVNGVQLHSEINGYKPFNIDLTPYLKPKGQNNNIAIKVDRSRYIDSRWYTGSGIYRDVTLHQVRKLHIPVWGTYITTPTVTDKNSTVSIQTTIKNTSNKKQNYQLIARLLDKDGTLVAVEQTHSSTNAATTDTQNQLLSLQNTKLWSPNTPYLYKLEVSIVQDGVEISKNSNSVGFRTLQFDPEKGFFLNGQHTLIKGVNLHHDAGLVGAAVPDDVWIRRLTKLKQAGVNAIRTAHNPASKAFLDLCDKMGFLVQAEIFDEWDNPKDKRLNQEERHDDYISRGYADYFQTHAEQDLKTSILRDRNHPSIIMWSIGNEIEWTYPRYKAATGYFDMNAAGNYFYNPPFISPEEIYQRFHESKEGKYVLAKTANKLSKWVKEMDTTRPVTANLILPSVSHISGYTDALDVIGYSYRRVIYDYGHTLFPGKMLMGHENVPQWHEWKAVIEREFVAGTFLWTGIDYLGESHNQWPRKAVNSGLLDLAGFANPSFHMFKSLWNQAPHIHLTTQTLENSLYKESKDGQLVEKKPNGWQTRVWFWHDVNDHWNYQPGQQIAVEVYSNCKSVELFLNGHSYGRQQLTHHPDRIYKWLVPYKTGQLTAKGLGDCRASDEITTAQTYSHAKVNTDRKKLIAKSNQVSHLDIQLYDSNDIAVKHQEAKITLEVSPHLQLVGMDNGRPNNFASFKTNSLPTRNGRALAIVKGIKAGNGVVQIKSNGQLLKQINILVEN
ncbi:glycoside hydrolase family 2 TIM barrel-domain containing protein [Catenovulum sediminis]|uniref:glycoside hydrolase family 2 TIM barrel-domain containing protein n=1 Tax=Catenovulum sediminis TaxID=1740262 RepID=UPI0011809D78|nr:glycoside hydrolase family 2 TIM barrel-domain containing protein [Catenovulum sediminis]